MDARSTTYNNWFFNSRAQNNSRRRVVLMRDYVLLGYHTLRLEEETCKPE